MNSITINTYKHKGKLALNIFWLSLCTFFLSIGIYGCFAKFQWSYLLTTIVVACISSYYIYNIRIYFWNKFIEIKVSIVNTELTVDILTDKPDDNYEQQKIDLTNVRKIYMLETRVKQIKYKSIEYIPLNTNEPKELDFLPWPFDCEVVEIEKILRLIKSNFPNIEIGF